jgi:hypothetical protein
VPAKAVHVLLSADLFIFLTLALLQLPGHIAYSDITRVKLFCQYYPGKRFELVIRCETVLRSTWGATYCDFVESRLLDFGRNA